MLWPSVAQAQLVLEIQGGTAAPWRIAVVPFEIRRSEKDNPQQVQLAVDVARVIEADLARYSGFESVAREDMLSLPRTAADIVRWDWLSSGVDFVLLGSVAQADTAERGQVQIAWYLYDVGRGQVVQSGRQSDAGEGLRRAAHRVSDRLHYYVLGVPGVSASRLAYVSARKSLGGQRLYRLVLSDSDGYNERVLFSSNEPIFAPAWSPDGRRIAFATRRDSWNQIHILDISTGQTLVLGPWGGNASEPDFSPHGDYLALTLSRNINPDIYIYDLKRGKLVRLTEHFAIDAEADWSPDGSELVFTSDRSGRPQLYRLNLLSGRISRLTFSTSYDGGGRYMPDGRKVIFVRSSQGKSHLSLLQTGTLEVQRLTAPGTYDAPTLSPDGRILLYSAQRSDSREFRGLRLAGASVPSVVGEFLLPVSEAAVRAPVWSPLFR